MYLRKVLKQCVVLVAGVFILNYTPTRNMPGPIARSDAYLPVRGNQCI